MAVKSMYIKLISLVTIIVFIAGGLSFRKVEAAQLDDEISASPLIHANAINSGSLTITDVPEKVFDVPGRTSADGKNSYVVPQMPTKYKAEFKGTSIQGSLTEEEPTQQHYYTAPYSGKYTFSVESNSSSKDHAFYFYILNEDGSTKNFVNMAATEETSFSLEKDKTYIFQVKRESFIGSYTIWINRAWDISQTTCIEGELTDYNQKNKYSITAAFDSQYIFTIPRVDKKGDMDVSLSLIVRDSKGKIASQASVKSNPECIVNLKKGETYTVQIEQRVGFCSYYMYIYHGKETVDIAPYDLVADSAEYKGRVNTYDYIASQDGLYGIEMSKIKYTYETDKISLDMCIKDENNTVVAEESDIQAESTLLFWTKKGHKYKVIVTQNTGFGSYVLAVVKPYDISEYTKVNKDQDQGYRKTIYSLRSVQNEDCEFYISSNGWNIDAPCNITVYDSNGSQITNKSGNNTLKCILNLMRDKTYYIVIEYYRYSLFIGQPNDVVDITQYDEIRDYLHYESQKNQYVYTASEDGVYLFQVFGQINGSYSNSLMTRLVIKDQKSKKVIGDNMSTNLSMRVNLKKNQTYDLFVSSNTRNGSYYLYISYAQPQDPTVTPTVAPAIKPTNTPTVTEMPTVTAKPTDVVTVTPTSVPDNSKVEILNFVKRIYVYVLDREPEVEGSEYWSNELYNFNRTGAEVAQGFIFSEEFNNRGTSNKQFVEILYKTFFNREADEGGMNYWLELLDMEAMDRVGVANAFVFSQEWADTCALYGIRSGSVKPSFKINPTVLTYAFVERIYTTAMGRAYDSEGRQYWASELANFNITGEQVGAAFFLSAEMEGYKLSDQEFLNRLYATFMNREPDPDGAAYWLVIMSCGGTRANVVYGFTRSPEFVSKCVEARIIPYL